MTKLLIFAVYFFGILPAGVLLAKAKPIFRDAFFYLMIFSTCRTSTWMIHFDSWPEWKGASRGFALTITDLLLFVFYGGFIGAELTLVYYCRRYQLNFLRLADVLAPSLAIGHMIGRLGCLAAGCCWGGFAKAGSAIGIRFPAAEHLPFGGFGTSSLAFSDQVKDPRWVDALGHVHTHAVEGATQISAYAQANGYTLPLYPTQLMEVVGELCLFAALLFFMNRKRFHGQIFATWLMGYAVLRTVTEFFRGDVARGYVFKYPAEDPLLLSTSQAIALALFATGALIAFFQLRRRKHRASPSPAAVQAT